MKKLVSLSFCLCIALFLAPLCSAQEEGKRVDDPPVVFKVVIHSENVTDRLSPSQVSNFLLKKKTRWPNGTAVLPADHEGRSEIRAAMSQAIHQRSVASIKNYWQRQIFSGHNTPPPEFEDDEAVLEYVATHPGAIGYVAVGTRTIEGVKAVLLDDSDD